MFFFFYYLVIGLVLQNDLHIHKMYITQACTRPSVYKLKHKQINYC